MDTLLIVSDEPALGETLASELAGTVKIEAVVFAQGPAALEREDHTLVLIDEYPDAAVLADRAKVPAIRIKRPVRLNDLLYTIRERLQGKKKGGQGELALGTAFLFSPSERSLRAVDASLRLTLTEKETELLLALLQAQGRAIPREQLLAQVWGYGEEIATHTLETHIYRLRGKLRQTSGGLDVLSLEEGGYALKL